MEKPTMRDLGAKFKSQSELHMWVGSDHYFVGVVNDQTTDEGCVATDEGHLEDFKAHMEQDELDSDFVVETDGRETCLRRHRHGIAGDGEKLLSYFRGTKDRE